MPQLEKISFLTQIFWAFASYLFIYTLLSAHVCPAVGAVLKSRSRVTFENAPFEADESLKLNNIYKIVDTQLDSFSLFFGSVSTSKNAQKIKVSKFFL